MSLTIRTIFRSDVGHLKKQNHWILKATGSCLRKPRVLCRQRQSGSARWPVRQRLTGLHQRRHLCPPRIRDHLHLFNRLLQPTLALRRGLRNTSTSLIFCLICIPWHGCTLVAATFLLTSVTKNECFYVSSWLAPGRCDKELSLHNDG